MKKLSLSVIIFISLAITACENPMMKKLLDPRTIYFDSNGGSYVSFQTLIKGEKISIPKTPVRGGYSFNGWFVDNNTFSERWDFNREPDGDMTLYAGWVGGAGGTTTIPVITIDRLADYLKNSSAGGSTNNPIRVRLKITDADITATASDASPLASILNESGKYVSLDLSGSSITNIPGTAFQNCSYLASITIPNGVISIGQQSFSNCTNLKSVNIPNIRKTARFT